MKWQALFFVLPVAFVFALQVAVPVIVDDHVEYTGDESGGSYAAPLSHPMVEHLRVGHYMTIGADDQGDIRIRPVEGTIEVTVLPRFLDRLQPDALEVLEMPAATEHMSITRYRTWLMMLHSYLTVKPPRKSG